ncbi:MAG TPA: hypothetical protein VH500_02740 [Nitrososphaeraceae archaeon]
MQSDSKPKAVIKRQIPFLIGGTITGLIFTFYLGFPLTLFANSIVWFVISLLCYKFVWKASGLTDQKYLLRYFLSTIKSRRKTGIIKNPKTDPD